MFNLGDLALITSEYAEADKHGMLVHIVGFCTPWIAIVTFLDGEELMIYIRYLVKKTEDSGWSTSGMSTD